MIEVLVSLTIVAFGVLGLLGLQARAISYQKDSFDRRSAAELVAQLGERLRANHLATVNGRYGDGGMFNPYFDAAAPTPAAITACAMPSACTSDEVSRRDWAQWLVELRRRIPASAAYLQWSAADVRKVTVSIAWPEPQQTTVADPACVDINSRLSVAIPITYRCYESAIYP